MNDLEVKNDEWKRFFRFCKEEASKERVRLQPDVKVSEVEDLSLNPTENFCEESKEDPIQCLKESYQKAFTPISRLFNRPIVKNLQENHKTKQPEDEENLHVIQIYKLPRNDENESSYDYGRNNFHFEPFLDHKPLKHQKLKKNYRESSTHLSLASHLFRHTVLVSEGEALEDLETEQSIQQNLELLRFLKQHQPFQEGADESLLKHEYIFKYRWLLKSLTFKTQPEINSELKKKLTKIYQFCRENVKIDNDHEVYKELNALLFKQDDKEVEELEILAPDRLKEILNICSKLLTEIEMKLKCMNQISFYYIKRQLDELYDLAGPGSKLHTIDKEEAIWYFSGEALEALRKFVQEYDKKYEPDTIFSSEEYFDKVEEARRDLSNPSEIWTSLLICYDASIRGLKLSLIERLSLGYDYPTKKFFQTLLEHPSSFFMSKDLLEINWRHLDDLILFYEGLLKKLNLEHHQNQKDSNSQLLESSTICANFYICFEITLDDNEKDSDSYIILDPILFNELSGSSNPASFNSKSLLAKSLCSDIVNKLYRQIGKAGRIISKKEQKKVRLRKINKIGIDFYSTYSDKELEKCIEKCLLEEENRIDRSYAKLLRRESNKIIECDFHSTIKNDDGEQSKMSSKKQINEGIQVSLFDYDYLREVLCEQSMCHLNGQSIGLLQINNLRHEEQTEEIPQQENANTIPQESMNANFVRVLSERGRSQCGLYTSGIGSCQSGESLNYFME